MKRWNLLRSYVVIALIGVIGAVSFWYHPAGAFFPHKATGNLRLPMILSYVMLAVTTVTALMTVWMLQAPEKFWRSCRHLTVTALMTVWMLLELHARAKKRRVGSRLFSILRCFRWFCSAANRELIDLISADLKRDTSDMRREGRARWFIRTALLWKILAGAILPICWDAIIRLLKAAVPIAKLVAAFKRPAG